MNKVRCSESSSGSRAKRKLACFSEMQLRRRSHVSCGFMQRAGALPGSKGDTACDVSKALCRGLEQTINHSLILIHAAIRCGTGACPPSQLVHPYFP